MNKLPPIPNEETEPAESTISPGLCNACPDTTERSAAEEETLSATDMTTLPPEPETDDPAESRTEPESADDEFNDRRKTDPAATLPNPG